MTSANVRGAAGVAVAASAEAAEPPTDGGAGIGGAAVGAVCALGAGALAGLAPEFKATAPPSTGAYGAAPWASRPTIVVAGADALKARAARPAPAPTAPGTAAPPGNAASVLVSPRPRFVFRGLLCEPSAAGALGPSVGICATRLSRAAAAASPKEFWRRSSSMVAMYFSFSLWAKTSRRPHHGRRHSPLIASIYAWRLASIKRSVKASRSSGRSVRYTGLW